MSCVCCISAHFQSFTGFNPLDLISCSCYILWGFEVCLILIHVNYGSQAGSWLLPSQFSSVQSLSHVWLFVTPWIAARQASLSITNSRSSPKLICIESVMPSSHLILCHPLLLLPPIPPSIRVFSASASVIPVNIQDWSPLGWTGWISLQFKGLTRVFSSTTVQNHQFFSTQLSS